MTDELWDLCDENRVPPGRTHRRGEPVPGGCRHLIVNVWIRCGAGALLISRRHPDKAWGGLWKCTGGSVLAGEESRAAAVREVQEELGLALDPNNGRLLLTETRADDVFADIWLFDAEAPLEDLTLQPDEVTDARWATMDDLRTLRDGGEWVPVIDFEAELACASEDEYIDLLTPDGVPTGQVHQRGQPLPPGLCMRGVDVWLRGADGRWLISRRHPAKTWGGLWACTCGAVQHGEESRAAAVREVGEELGLCLSPENGTLALQLRIDQVLFDVWVFDADVTLEDLTLQADEVTDVRWATAAEIDGLLARGAWLSTVDYYGKL